MFIVWGFKARNKTIASGSFFCPREGGDRNYSHKSARKWFTLYFIPLIPLGDLGDYVECSSCGSTYYPSVLGAPTTQRIEDVMTTAIRHVAVNMLRADGVIHDSERAAALAVVAGFASRPYGAADLESDLASLDATHLRDNLEELGAALNEHGKEQVLNAALQLAASDGHVDQAEIALATEIGEYLTMARAHIEGTIAIAMRDGIPQPQPVQQIQQPPQPMPPSAPAPMPPHAPNMAPVQQPPPMQQNLPSEFGSPPPRPSS